MLPLTLFLTLRNERRRVITSNTLLNRIREEAGAPALGMSHLLAIFCSAARQNKTELATLPFASPAPVGTSHHWLPAYESRASLEGQQVVVLSRTNSIALFAVF